MTTDLTTRKGRLQAVVVDGLKVIQPDNNEASFIYFDLDTGKLRKNGFLDAFDTLKVLSVGGDWQLYTEPKPVTFADCSKATKVRITSPERGPDIYGRTRAWHPHSLAIFSWVLSHPDAKEAGYTLEIVDGGE